VIEIVVYGIPATQGSKSFKGLSKAGHAIMVESSSKKLKPWRLAVSWAASEQRKTIKGPIIVEMVFTLPKPKSAPKRRKTWPDRTPDLSKLARSAEDSLSDAGIWEDDARVIEYRLLAKRYPNEGVDALDRPGVVIRLFPVVEAPLLD
jgi:Holliday junction resolvase RusA-like endonuclease